MTFSLHGTGVSRGIAIGKAHVVQNDQLNIKEYKIGQYQIQAELQRLDDAINNAREQLRAIRDRIPKEVTADIAEFIDTHLLMLSDNTFSLEPKRIIKERLCNAEWAVKMNRDLLVLIFDEMDDAYLSTRRDDVDHVVNRILRELLNESPLLHEVPDRKFKGYIVLADDLTPGDAVLMQKHGIIAFATEYGGPTSHTAILAQSIGIPAIVGLHGARRFIRDNDTIIVDGIRGAVLVEPDKKMIAHYQKSIKSEKRYTSSLSKLKRKRTQTLDGVPIKLMANIDLPRDFDIVRSVGAAGVGLYRTESLYMNREQQPDEEEHFATYTGVIDKLKGLPLTIRTLDRGPDSLVDGGRQTGPFQSNPALGLRAIRLYLKEPALFRPQFRAIIRASAFGPVRLMLPMISNIHEMKRILEMIAGIKHELDQENIDYDHELSIGGMIEVPAAAICADIFADELDFLSIGTNDLIQYIMAMDRLNEEVSYLYDPLHPAVLRLIKSTIAAGEKAGIPVAMCGEMASERQYTRLLLALGLREFSVHPAALLEIRQIINQCNLAELQKLGKKILKAKDGIKVAGLLGIFNRDA